MINFFKSLVALAFILLVAGSIGFFWLISTDLKVNYTSPPDPPFRPTPTAPKSTGPVSRVLTNKVGKKISAKLISKHDNSVTIITNGDTYTISLDSLSEADQAFIRSWNP